MKTIFLITFSIAGLFFLAAGQASIAQQIRGSEAILPLASELPPKLIVDPPLPDPLAEGKVIIQYRTENLRIVTVFGAAAQMCRPALVIYTLRLIVHPGIGLMPVMTSQS